LVASLSAKLIVKRSILPGAVWKTVQTAFKHTHPQITLLEIYAPVYESFQNQIQTSADPPIKIISATTRVFSWQSSSLERA
jgi:hypothetical protein